MEETTQAIELGKTNNVQKQIQQQQKRFETLLKDLIDNPQKVHEVASKIVNRGNECYTMLLTHDDERMGIAMILKDFIYNTNISPEEASEINLAMSVIQQGAMKYDAERSHLGGVIPKIPKLSKEEKNALKPLLEKNMHRLNYIDNSTFLIVNDIMNPIMTENDYKICETQSELDKEYSGLSLDRFLQKNNKHNKYNMKMIAPQESQEKECNKIIKHVVDRKLAKYTDGKGKINFGKSGEIKKMIQGYNIDICYIKHQRNCCGKDQISVSKCGGLRTWLYSGALQNIIIKKVNNSVDKIYKSQQSQQEKMSGYKKQPYKLLDDETSRKQLFTSVLKKKFGDGAVEFLSR